MPNPASPYFHALPVAMHYTGSAVNHFVELAAPFLLLMSRTPRVIGGAIQIGFQAVIIASGNLSFLNYLTIIPALACIDDDVYKWLFPAATVNQVAARLSGDVVQPAHSSTDGDTSKVGASQPSTAASRVTPRLSSLPSAVVGCLVAYLSIPVVVNLMSTNQVRQSVHVDMHREDGDAARRWGTLTLRFVSTLCERVVRRRS